MRYLGGHLGTTVTALVDGQLDPASCERAWAHVHGCPTCRRQVEREGWVKTQLATMAGEQGPPPQLLGSLYGLGSATGDPEADQVAAWAAVDEIERRGRGRRRAGIALAGAGSVSAAVLGLASLTGATLGIGGASTSSPSTTTPSTAPTAMIAPLARVHGRLPFEARAARPEGGVQASREGEGPAGLQR
jgi:hypothetical protein